MFVTHLQTEPSSFNVELGINNAADFNQNIKLHFIDSNDTVQASARTFRRFAVGQQGSSGMAYVLTDEPDLWRIVDYQNGSLASQTLLSISGAINPVAIAVDDPTMSLIVGDAGIPGIIDASSLW